MVAAGLTRNHVIKHVDLQNTGFFGQPTTKPDISSLGAGSPRQFTKGNSWYLHRSAGGLQSVAGTRCFFNTSAELNLPKRRIAPQQGACRGSDLALFDGCRHRSKRRLRCPEPDSRQPAGQTAARP